MYSEWLSVLYHLFTTASTGWTWSLAATRWKFLTCFVWPGASVLISLVLGKCTCSYFIRTHTFSMSCNCTFYITIINIPTKTRCEVCMVTGNFRIFFGSVINLINSDCNHPICCILFKSFCFKFYPFMFSIILLD